MKGKQGTRLAPCSLIVRNGNIILVPFHFEQIDRLRLLTCIISLEETIFYFVLQERNVRSVKTESSKRCRERLAK